MSWFCGDNPCRRNDCAFDLWAPDHRNKIVNTAFSAHAYHQQTIEDFINALAASDDPNDWSNQYAAIEVSNIDYARLTSDEIEYIEREVTKRR